MLWYCKDRVLGAHEPMKKQRKTIISRIFLKLFGKSTIKKQLYYFYFVTLFLPIAVIGTVLVINIYRNSSKSYYDLVESDNLRKKTIFLEITSQIYNISENVVKNQNVKELLSAKSITQKEYRDLADVFLHECDFLYNYQELEKFTIYTDIPNYADYRIFQQADEETANAEWFLKACESDKVTWAYIQGPDKYGNQSYKLCLVRSITAIEPKGHMVLVLTVNDTYLHTRMENAEYKTIVTVDGPTVIYATDRRTYENESPLRINYSDSHYHYSGRMNWEGITCLADVVTVNMYNSDSSLFIATLNTDGLERLKHTVWSSLLLILFAILLPGIVIVIYTQYFSNRVNLLRDEIHKARQGDYHIYSDFRGKDELSEAFSELQLMIEKIQEKDAAMYQAMLNEQELQSKQQEMEFKMLASQINPHFLYNTLETIRMNAFTAGDRETATAIKLLGKSLRYVLENTGTVSTTIEKEMDYIENYIKIQKLRFADRVNYSLEVDEGLALSDYQILPLLLQPIVENAILHGLEQKEKDGRITVKIRHQGEILIDISDNGCGMDKDQVQKLQNSISVRNPSIKESIGLYNINQRIKLCYGVNYGMWIASKPGEGTTVSLRIPAIPADSGQELCTN